MDAEETWLATHKEDVRTSLNNVRNFVQQELRKLVLHHYETETEDLLPTVAEILKLMERKGLASGNNKGRMEEVFDFYWDKLLPKVAGHVNWCPTKRHYSLLSAATTPSPIEGEADIPCVHHTSEGILVALWEHCFPRWRYECIQKRTNKAVDPEHEDMKGKDYITAIAGRNKYGGWTNTGRDRVKVLSALCKAARKKPSVEAIERDALQRIRYVICFQFISLVMFLSPCLQFCFLWCLILLHRFVHKRDELDQKRKKKPKSKKGPVYEEEVEDSDCEEWGV